jgi:hypothetical protein
MCDLGMAPILILLVSLLHSPADCNPVRSRGQDEDGDGWPDGWAVRPACGVHPRVSLAPPDLT